MGALKMVLEKLSSGLKRAFEKLTRASFVDEKVVKEFVLELQRALLQADVNVELVFELSERIEKRALSEKLPPGVTRRQYIVKMVYDELTEVLGKKSVPLEFSPGKSKIIMLVGIQGSGKTTTAAKLARYFKKRGVKTGLVCADTFRPGAFEQLNQLADSAGIPIYGHLDAKKPVSLARKGIAQFKQGGYELIFVDTAGRHKEEKGLLREMKNIANAIKADEIILVIDGTLGQQAYAQAKAFHEATEIGSIFVTKLDGSARGGGAISAVAATGAPIKFVGTGEKIEDIEPFNPPRFVGRLLGMGDLKSLLEQIKEAEAEPERELAKAILRGKFSLQDMYDQIKKTRKMGPLRKLFSFLPSFGSLKMPNGIEDIAEEKMDKWVYIMDSMTIEEKENPKMIKKSRLNRIARGSGTDPREAKELLNNYFTMLKMFKRFGKRRGLPRIPGLQAFGKQPPEF